MKALVYKSTGNWYQVKGDDGRFLQVRLKGKFKIDDITSTNPIAVGDFVDVEGSEDDDSLVISKIYPRQNYINRASPHNRKLHHIVAANLDQSVLFATLAEPKTSLGFIDRFLVVCEAYHVPAIIVFNKTDVYKKKELEKLEWITEMYQNIGYPVLHISLEKGENVEALVAMLKNKTSLVSGHSGVGKSTFINLLFPEIGVKTQEVSSWSGKGLHTTTFAEMYDLEGGGKIIDTPGIREMGIIGIPRAELSHYYPEMRKLLPGCRFNNCMHTHESGCAVKMEVGKTVHEERYLSYLNILDTIPENDY